jgi:2-oxoglutarate ferredoxin oxidoreductase subunit gamma
MLIKTIFAGFGGQGVLAMGLNLSQAAMTENKHVTYLPAYGAEVRGGTANCTVAVSDDEIASPVASAPNFVVSMNHPSMIRFQNKIKTGGTYFINSTLVNGKPNRTDIKVIEIPANEIAEKLGNVRSANMIMLGAFIKETGIVSIRSVVDALTVTFKGKQKIVDINAEALNKGYQLS